MKPSGEYTNKTGGTLMKFHWDLKIIPALSDSGQSRDRRRRKNVAVTDIIGIINAIGMQMVGWIRALS